MRAFILSFAMIGLATTQAAATTIFEYRETCPIGGEQFDAVGYGSYSTFGMRLDGKPYGSSEFPLEVPVCPTNGFVLYKEASAYSPAQIAALTPYVAGDYRAIIGESSHYRATHLARAAGEPVSSQAWLMLQATWQVDRDAERFARYQSEFLTLVDVAISESSPNETVWWIFQFRAANAERQLGRFDTALARLSALPMDRLASAGRDGELDSEFAEGLPQDITLLRGIIEARDSSLEPEAARPRR